jgi:hypothetical protein
VGWQAVGRAQESEFVSGAHVAVAADVVERYVVRIDAHLLRLAQGHDPMGHLFGIERLARGARAELSLASRQSEDGRRKR